VAPVLKGTDVTLTNCKIVQGPPIADHAMALLLALTRDLDRTIPARTKEVLPRDVGGLFHLVELGGKTAVVVGVGGIGTQIAVRAHAFGMTVIGVDPKDIPFLPFISRVVKPEQIDKVLPLADVVFISAPHTPQSEGMIGPRQFEEMKRGTYFIAVSRGKPSIRGSSFMRTTRQPFTSAKRTAAQTLFQQPLDVNHKSDLFVGRRRHVAA
jgi:phosphoglycerate dehydrogenase-like enzyme